MKSIVWAAVCVALLCIGSQARAVVYDGHPDDLPQPFPAKGVLIVEYYGPLQAANADASSDGVAYIGVESLDKVHAKYGVKRVERLFPVASGVRMATRSRVLDQIVRLSFPEDVDAGNLLADLRNDPHVKSADYAMVQPVYAVPNDPSFGSQWSLQDPQDNDVDAPAAWDMEPGDSIIILGATDTGVQHDHMDLAGASPFTNGNCFINWAEYSGAPFTDDDGNGFYDDIRGWDFVDVSGAWPGEDGTNPDNDPMDFNGHGSHVSGIMAAMTNNATGVAGMAGGFYGAARGCKIMPLRIGWSQAHPTAGYEVGYVRMDFAAQAINYGVMMGVKVFNCSWGSSGDAAFRAAVDNAVANGVTFAVAAGNDNSTGGGYLQARPDVINVASTTSSDTKSSFSNYGVYVDVSAPGSSIYNTYSNHGSATYATLSGTSMAAPHVAGLVGLIRSKNPELEKYRVDSIVIATTDNIDALNAGYAGKLGSGRINAASALAATPIADFFADVRFGQAPLAVQFTDHSYLNPTTWIWDLGNGQTPADVSPATVYDEGVYTVSLTTQSDAGSQTTTKANLIRVVDDTLGGANDEALVNHSVTLPLLASLSVPVDSIVFPFAMTGPSSITLDTVVPDGALADLFTTAELDNYLAGTAMGVLRFKSDTGAVTVPAGSLASFHFDIGSGVPGEEAVVLPAAILTDSFAVYTPFGVYEPAAEPTVARVANYLSGDVNLDGFHRSSDIIAMVAFVFKGGTLPIPDLADVDNTNTANSADIIYMVSYLFKSGPPPI